MLKIVLAVLFPALSLIAQNPDGLPTIRHLDVVAGAWIDLDAGVVLPSKKLGAFEADVQFGRDGIGFYLLPLRGGMVADLRAEVPGGDDYFDDRIRIPLRDEPSASFVRTNHGVARVALQIINAYGFASGGLEWVVVPPADPVFLAPPSDVACRWHGGKLVVTWSGELDSYLVTIETDGKRRKEVVQQQRLELADLDREAVHRIFVRAMDGAAISPPGSCVQHGKMRGPRHETTTFADRWYDASGGLALRSKADREEGADVVFYLYGVYVPGGGVQKLGSGRDLFLSTSRLPSKGYKRNYDRLDDDDVLAVQLPDGRRGLVYLDPHGGGDVRGGMDVHSVFLVDGRSTFLVPPTPAVASEQGVVTLTWSPVAGADSYELQVEGHNPIETTETKHVFENLPKNRMFDIQIRARSNGDLSRQRLVRGHTFGGEYVHRRITLDSSGKGVQFETGELVENSDLKLTGGAGGSAFLSFATPGGHAPGIGGKLGDFGGAKRIDSATFGSDTRNEFANEFFVYTSDGGVAHVHIVQRGWPRTTIEYVWRPKADGQ